MKKIKIVSGVSANAVRGCREGVGGSVFRFDRDRRVSHLVTVTDQSVIR